MKILRKYVPNINVNSTVLKSRGLGFNIIQAKTLKIVLSISDETIVEKLFLNQRNLLLVNSEIFSKNHISKN